MRYASGQGEDPDAPSRRALSRDQFRPGEGRINVRRPQLHTRRCCTALERRELQQHRPGPAVKDPYESIVAASVVRHDDLIPSVMRQHSAHGDLIGRRVRRLWKGSKPQQPQGVSTTEAVHGHPSSTVANYDLLTRMIRKDVTEHKAERLARGGACRYGAQLLEEVKGTSCQATKDPQPYRPPAAAVLADHNFVTRSGGVHIANRQVATVRAAGTVEGGKVCQQCRRLVGDNAIHLDVIPPSLRARQGLANDQVTGSDALDVPGCGDHRTALTRGRA